MAPRGLSKEEKRIKMMEIFHDSAEFFSFKEIEKIAPKQKGIGALLTLVTQLTSVQQSVKEVIDELKSDGLLVSEKIGTGVYYWSFPSAAGAQKQGALDRVSKEVADVEEKISEAAVGLKQAEKGREDTAERRKLLELLKAEEAQAAIMRAELDAYGAADPLKYEKKRQAVEVAKRATARWTDNVLITFSTLKSMGAEEDNLREMFNLAENWDDLETIGK